MADRMAVLQNGSIRQLDTPQEVYNYPCNKFCAEFLGLINLLPGRRNGKLWDCALGQIPAINRFSSEHELGAIRPEHIKICSPGTDNTIPGKLIKSTFLGEASLYQVDCGKAVLTVRENAGQERRPGDAVGLYLEEGFFQKRHSLKKRE